MQSYYGIGRRKSAMAQVFINENLIKKKKPSTLLTTSQLENCEIMVNNKTFLTYFQKDESAIQKIQKFLKIFGFKLNLENSLNNSAPSSKKKTITVRTAGGGLASQKDAICLALANSFCRMNSEFLPQIKEQKWLTQDARVKERKKYGLKKSRKAPQYSKR